jgi:hypothetical protein
MAKAQSNHSLKRGRPKGPPRVGVLVRLPPEQLRDLRILRDILEGRPPINGLFEEAVRLYISQKLDDRRIRSEFDRRVDRSLQVITARASSQASRVMR